MPRLKPQEVAAAMKPSRTPKQLANDARLRSLRSKAQVSSEDLSGARSEVEISTHGKAEAVERQIEVIPAAQMKSKAAEEAFMNEMVEIQIEADDDPNAPQFLHSGHNGIDQYIQRGVPQTIRRKFLYSLVAAKRKQFSCAFGKDGSGNEFNRMAGRTNTTHRISIINDTPQGRAQFVKWMQAPS